MKNNWKKGMKEAMNEQRKHAIAENTAAVDTGIKVSKVDDDYDIMSDIEAQSGTRVDIEDEQSEIEDAESTTDEEVETDAAIPVKTKEHLKRSESSEIADDVLKLIAERVTSLVHQRRVLSVAYKKVNDKIKEHGKK